MKKKVRASRASNVDKVVGVIIKNRRKSLGLNQMDLGKKIGVTFQQVQKYENGTNRVSIGRFLKLAAALSVTPTRLITEIQKAA
jgi:transcriptional regulator with XRE-family HTH domain